MEQDINGSVVIRNTNNVWVNDDQVSSCRGCGKIFGIFIRKHHCRNCGNIFCYKCVEKTINIPDFIIVDVPLAADYWNPSHYFSVPFASSSKKVCNVCYDNISKKIIENDSINKLMTEPLSIDRISSMGLSENVKNHYLANLRNIQYYLPNRIYSDFDKKILEANSVFFRGHSKYLTHYIKSIDWKTSERKIIDLLTSERENNCSDILCTRTCRELLSYEDCINILYSSASNLPLDILEHIFKILSNVQEQIILCHLSFFINMIKNNQHIFNFLVELLTKSKKLIHHTYWYVNNLIDAANIEEVSTIEFMKLFDGKVSAIWGEELLKSMHQAYVFFKGLSKELDDPKKYLQVHFDKYKPITLPYDPDIKILDFYPDSISIKNSYTKPVFIKFLTTVGEIFLIFKNECIMNDVAVLNLMTLCNFVLQEKIGQNFDVVVYPIMPLTCKSGMIGVVKGATTIHDIILKNQTILTHIISCNGSKIIDDVMDRYMYSLVSYTLHSYFFGLGDRHLQNIMITQDAAIFHIDFGYILGADISPLTANIKLNSNMLEVIGGIGSQRHKLYLELCAKGVVTLRKLFNTFFIILNQLTSFGTKDVENFIMSRCQPRQLDQVVIDELFTIIQQSSNAYPAQFRDFLHFHKQEGTLQSGINYAFGNVVTLVKNLTYNS